MVQIISFEGCVASGKTSLTNYLSHRLGVNKLIECTSENPFVNPFYAGVEVNLEIEMTFLMIHFGQIKRAAMTYEEDEPILADFSIEKNLVFARQHLKERQLEIFESAYEYVVSRTRLPFKVMFLDLSQKIMHRRIYQRGRPYELESKLAFFNEYRSRIKAFYMRTSSTYVQPYNVDDLVLDPDNHQFREIEKNVKQAIRTIKYSKKYT